MTLRGWKFAFACGFFVIGFAGLSASVQAGKKAATASQTQPPGERPPAQDPKLKKCKNGIEAYQKLKDSMASIANKNCPSNMHNGFLTNVNVSKIQEAEIQKDCKGGELTAFAFLQGDMEVLRNKCAAAYQFYPDCKAAFVKLEGGLLAFRDYLSAKGIPAVGDPTAKKLHQVAQSERSHFQAVCKPAIPGALLNELAEKATKFIDCGNQYILEAGEGSVHYPFLPCTQASMQNIDAGVSDPVLTGN